jgi:signal transduction histidine kinase
MRKLTWSLMLVVLVAIVSLGWTLDSLFEEYQSSTETDELFSYRQLGVALAATLDKQSNIDEFMARWQQQQQLKVTVSDLANFTLPESLKSGFYQGQPLTLEFDNSISLHFILPVHSKVLTITLVQNLNTQDNSWLQLTLTIIFYVGILTLVFIWLYPLIKRLNCLRITAKAFGEGDMKQRISIHSTSYIADIESEFNRMAQRIETLISDNKLLGNAVSHDLRTPLARLRFGIEALQETNNAKTRAKYEQHITRDIDEMEKLVAVLLSYARLDQGMIAVQRYPVDLNAVINECVHAVSSGNKVINWQASDKAVVQGDVNFLSMLVNNLLQNALQYSTQQIVIKVTSNAANVYLSVTDDGPGIVKNKREELLKPFIRGDNIVDKPGYGMGLAIVARIAFWHSAALSIDEDAELGGAKFCLIFTL